MALDGWDGWGDAILLLFCLLLLVVVVGVCWFVVYGVLLQVSGLVLIGLVVVVVGVILLLFCLLLVVVVGCLLVCRV